MIFRRGGRPGRVCPSAPALASDQINAGRPVDLSPIRDRVNVLTALPRGCAAPRTACRRRPGLAARSAVTRAGPGGAALVVSPGEAPSDRGRQRPPRPGCLILCHPVPQPGRTERVSTTCLTPVPDKQKALSRPGKGLELWKLVAGEDLNLRPLGYEQYCDTRSHVVSERVEEVWLMPGT